QIEDDARLVVAVARTAAAHGATVLTYCEVTGVRRGVVAARDVRTGQSFEIHARHVVNAAGVWAGSLAGDVKLTPSKGAHVIVDGAALGSPRAALAVPIAGETARWVGATPTHDGLVIIGVTDDAYSGAIVDAPEVTAEEEHYLLGALSVALATPLTHADVIGSYAGFRPLLAGEEGSTADLSRRHSIVEDPETGMVTVVGGKLTTYRRMAQDAVDRMLGDERRPCRTAHLPLVG